MNDAPSPGSRTADLLYDTFFAAGIGGSTVALFFLLVDLMGGEPLLTPSLLGSALFLDVDVSEIASARIDMVALYSLVHFAAFGALGFVFSVLYDRLGLDARSGIVTVLVLFVVLEGGSVALGATLLSEVAARIGWVPVGFANLLTAITMGGFLRWAHRPEGGAMSQREPGEARAHT